MPPSPNLDHLELAVRHAQEAKRKVDRQRQIVAEIEAHGFDAANARKTLELFEQTLQLMQDRVVNLSIKERDSTLKESHARVQQALAAGGVVAFEWDVSTDKLTRSDNAVRILGFDPFTGRQFASRIHLEDRARFRAYMHGDRPDDGSHSITFRFIRPDGQEVWLEYRAKAEFDAEGNYTGLKGLIRDVTRRKRNEEHQQRLVAELDHRVKNTLARVAAVVRSTSQRSNSMQEFTKGLDRRIRSMADAHNLLSRTRWQGADLADLVRLQLAPYTSTTKTTIAGPDITLATEATQALAMVLQELVTNALKYGALSNSDGRLLVRWNRPLSEDASGCAVIEWRETGGPRVATPAQTGTAPASYAS